MPEAVSNLLLLVLGGSFGGGAVGLYLARSQRRKLDAETGGAAAASAQTITAAALQLVGPLRAELEAAQAEVRELRAEVHQLRAELGYRP